MIRFHDVAVTYPGAKRAALAGVSLEASRGEITAVVGPNGSGKSTLVRALLGRVPLQRGTIKIDGRAQAEWSPLERARHVAVVPQREEALLSLTLREYVALSRYVHRSSWMRERAADRAAVESALGAAGVAELADRRTDAVSGGEWQRARIARALAQETAALILDEPTTFLDIAHEMAVFELLHQLALGGKAVLLVSHQLNLVARFAHRMVLLAEGAVVSSGTVADVMQAPILERVYAWPLVITRDPAIGAPTLVPLRSARR
ncbi:MAG TPA: ABC transporter ATP-binding protein [Gemmatimonadaceae bacterium]|nr:ABC transporter ATP-binding protein [Gemmatimonadaceae bacterium]